MGYQIIKQDDDGDQLLGSLGRLSPTTRSMMLESLTELRNRDLYQAVLDNVQDVIARDFAGLGATAIGVVFHAAGDSDDDGCYLSTFGQVAFSDGSVRDHDFEDLEDAFTERYRRVPARFTVALDLETGTFDESSDRHSEPTHTRLRRAGRIPLTEHTTTSNRPALTAEPTPDLTVDGITFDDLPGRDTYLTLKDLPEDKILYLARSDGHRLKNRNDQTYWRVANEQTDPEWMAHMAARIALSNGWIDEQEHNRLTR